MIRIVTFIKARLSDGASPFQELPLVPASATLRTDVEDTESGWQVKQSLSARLHSTTEELHDILYGDLILALGFEDGTEATIGTEDIPVRLRVNESDTLDISAEHESGAR